jgi:replicative DNA helicase
MSHPFLEPWDHLRTPEPSKVRALPLAPAEPVTTALEAADVPTADSLVPWPWEALERTAGPLAPGSLTIVSARTGSGKTLFIRNWLHWLSVPDGPGVAYFPTETPVREVLRGIACAELGVNPVEVSRGDFSRVPEGAKGFLATTTALSERLLRPRDEFRGPPLMLFQAARPSLALIRQTLTTAKQQGCAIACIDHILRLDIGDGTQLFAEVTTAVRGLKQLAEDLQIAMVITSQQGRQAFAGDRLAAFQPPDLSALKGSGALEEEADLVIFLHRILRDTLSPEQMTDVRRGKIPLQEAIAPHLMGVAIGKHRLDGAKSGAQERLWVEHGRVSDLPAPERVEWERQRHGIRTGGTL